jgi:hypothetical protein
VRAIGAFLETSDKATQKRLLSLLLSVWTIRQICDMLAHQECLGVIAFGYIIQEAGVAQQLLES